MTYDDVLADRVRALLAGEDDVSERAMFGGLGFMVRGNMALAASSTADLMVRVDPDRAEEWIDGETVRPMEMRGRRHARLAARRHSGARGRRRAPAVGGPGRRAGPQPATEVTGAVAVSAGAPRLTTVSRR